MGLFLNQAVHYLHVFLENNKHFFAYLEMHNSAHLILRQLLTLSNLHFFIQ